MDEQTALIEKTKAEIFESVVINNDLSKMSAEGRVSYYTRICDSLGLNPMTKPFEYIKLNNKLTLYARKDCTDQLRKIYHVSLDVLKTEKVGSNILVWVKATLPSGRYYTDCGSVPANNDPNTIMKCLTKAKRRVTLSICGLGMLDESEIATIPKTRAKIMNNYTFCPACQTKTYNVELNQCESCKQSKAQIKANLLSEKTEVEETE